MTYVKTNSDPSRASTPWIDLNPKLPLPTTGPTKLPTPRNCSIMNILNIKGFMRKHPLSDPILKSNQSYAATTVDHLAYAKSLGKLGITHPIAAPPKLYVK
jgi:hypothetical protein